MNGYIIRILFLHNFSRLAWSRKGDSVLHIELRRWADLLLIAPASANTIAKAANGICDNLLLCVLRAWDPLRPVICCPAMNTRMMDHPSLISHFALLKSYGYEIIEAEMKELACGDIGKGALASVSTIVSRCRVALSTIANRDGERESARESIHSILRLSESTERRVWSVCNRSSLQSGVLMTCTIVSIFLFGFLTGIRFR
jgi:phosphopantothenoylcysteine synthetase/decarboxylase